MSTLCLYSDTIASANFVLSSCCIRALVAPGLYYTACIVLFVELLTGINPGKSHGQGPWVSHRDRHKLENTRRLTGEALPARYYCVRGRLQWRPRRVLTRLG